MKEKSFERKQELLDAALDEFSTQSYDEASLNRIIKQAGISKGTFYYHFPDKKALYLYLLEHGVQAKWEFIREATTSSSDLPDTKDIFAMFKWQARIGVQFAKVFPKYHQLTKQFVGEKGTEVYEEARAVLGKDEGQSLQEMIHVAYDQGTFEEAFPREFVVKVVSHLFASFHDLFDATADLEVEQMLQNLDDYVDFMRHGLERRTNDEDRSAKTE